MQYIGGSVGSAKHTSTVRLLCLCLTTAEPVSTVTPAPRCGPCRRRGIKTSCRAPPWARCRAAVMTFAPVLPGHFVLAGFVGTAASVPDGRPGIMPKRTQARPTSPNSQNPLAAHAGPEAAHLSKGLSTRTGMQHRQLCLTWYSQGTSCTQRAHRKQQLACPQVRLHAVVHAASGEGLLTSMRENHA